MQILAAVGGTYSGVAPTMGSATSGVGGWTATITNYDAAYTYSATTTAGSVSLSGSGITQSGLGNGASSTVTVTTTRSGYESATGTVAGSAQNVLDTPTLSAATATYGGFTFTITNYDAANTYTISTSAGSVSRSGSTVTQAGLGNGASATVSVTASRSGFATSATATRAGTAIPTCSNTGYSFTTTEGGNLGTCGIIPCGAGSTPAYDILYVQVTPDPCMNGATVVNGGYIAYIGGWYCQSNGLTC
jgi:titin